MQLARQRQQLDRPLVQGILGGQGTGKTTLTQVLQLVLNHLGYQSACLSIDDFYKTFAERQNLRREDARLIWRGPPGTHDVDLALQVLDELRYPVTHRPIEIPRFDKSAWNGAGDRTTPDQVQDVDIVMFEGWFVGVRPVPPEQLESLPNPIQTPEDYEFAKDNNARLKAYLPLWQRLDRLIVLLPEDYRFSKTWRMEAEHRMKAKGRTGMTDKQISQFVEYFWKALHPEVFILPLAHSSEWTDLVIEINAQHVPTRVHAP
jgi:D-glycerate 3-kinase